MPERWKGPPLTQEYLVWYLDEYVPPIDYEGQLFSLYFPFAPLLGLLLVVGLVWLFFRFYRKGPGQKKVFFPLVAAGFLAGPPPLGDPLGQRPAPAAVLASAADLKFSHRQFPPQAKTPPSPPRRFLCGWEGGCVLHGVRGPWGRCPPPRRERTPEGCPAPGGIASPGWGSGCRPPSPPHRAGCRPGGCR